MLAHALPRLGLQLHCWKSYPATCQTSLTCNDHFPDQLDQGRPHHPHLSQVAGELSRGVSPGRVGDVLVVKGADVQGDVFLGRNERL